MGTARAEGWAEIANGLAYDLLECVAGAAEFFTDLVRSGAGEIWVRPSVIADYMTAAGDELDKGGLLAGIFADEEEGGFDAVVVEEFEQARCKGGVGAIVEG